MKILHAALFATIIFLSAGVLAASHPMINLRALQQKAALEARGISSTVAKTIAEASFYQTAIAIANLQTFFKGSSALVVTQPTAGTSSFDFCKVNPAPNINYSGCSFVGVNFAGYDLSGANFTGANLNNANFSGANLTKANFSWALFSGTNFAGANLTSTIFSNGWSEYSNYTGAKVTGFHLPQALQLLGSIWTDGSSCKPSNEKCTFVGNLP